MTTESLFSVKNKLGVITGAAGALGGTLAERLSELGSDVIILDINPEKLEARKVQLSKYNVKVYAYICDVTDQDNIEKVATHITESVGVPDYLINAAGGNNPEGTSDVETVTSEDLLEDEEIGFFGISTEGLEKTFELNLIGTILPSKVFARYMVKRGSGSILNFSSMSAVVPLTKVGAYSAAKAAVANFTRWLAVHLAPSGVRVNALAPGFFMTEQLLFLHIDQATGEYTPRAKKIIEHTPMRRYGEPEELLGATVWLISDSASFVTGAFIPIDGGFSSYAI